jgi:polar amino acid transport system substrate-binding protein
MTIAITPALRAELAPTGKLRAGFNLSNQLLVNQASIAGQLTGIVVDLAAELGRRFGVAVEHVRYPSPGPLADAAGHGEWDVAFLGAEAERAKEISFTAAYVEIEATYMVPANSPIRGVADADRPGVRIAISGKSAYDLYLTRTLKHAQLVRTNGAEASLDLFLREKFDALACLRPSLVAFAARAPGARILDDRFTAIQQAIGTPVGRDQVAAYLRAFAEEIKASGLAASLIEKHGIRGLNVAKPA